MSIDCLRRFWKTIGPLYNPEYGIDLAGLSVADAGNVYLPKGASTGLEQGLQSLTDSLIKIKSAKKERVTLAIGGSKEISYATIAASFKPLRFGSLQCWMIEISAGKKLGVLCLSDCIDANRPFDFGKIDQASWLRHLTADFALSQDNTSWVFAGIVGEHVAQEEIQFVKEKLGDCGINFMKDIRKMPNDQFSQSACLTQAGKFVEERLSELSKSCSECHVILSLESINV
jgi:arginase family enzyme